MSKIFLSVVIPCYDEMANLQKGVLDKVEHFLEKSKISYEVIIADDGSTDGSREFIEDFTKDNSHFLLLKNQHLGKVGAVTSGVLASKGEYVLFTDMDQATPIEEVSKLIPEFESGYDVVIGSRSGQRKGAPWTRKLMSQSMIILRKALVGMKSIEDTQCGFKMFRHDVAIELFTRIKKIHEGFQSIQGSNVTAGFDVELLYLAEKAKFKIKEVPVHWLYVESRRVNPINDSINGVIDLIRIKKRALQGVYK